MSSKRPPDEEESYMIPHKHPRQLACSNQLASFVEVVSCNDVPDEEESYVIPRKQRPPDEEEESYLIHRKQQPPDEEEESYLIARKHPRQLACSNQLASFVEVFSCNDVPQKLHTSVGEGEGGFNKSGGEETLVSSNFTELAIGVDEFETRAPANVSSLPCVTRSTSEEDCKSEAAVCMSFYPGFSEPGYPTRTPVLNEETYSSLFDIPPRRQVSVGPDHQADVPVWGLPSIVNMSDPNLAFLQSSISNQKFDDYSREKLMGSCIIPMPDPEVFVYNSNKDGNDTTDCSCQDVGSIRCVRRHIVEEREKLRGIFGQEIFMELGFCDMGEEVAMKWSVEEEQVFHEVVFSNPASLGKNFWDHLSVAFPSRTKKEFVSYYFNVFILRKRAEQNRLDPLNIDSDNDEWQGSEDSDYECGTTEEDEDSMVESPVDRDDPVCGEHEEQFYDSGEGIDHSNDNSGNGNVGDDGGGLIREEDGGTYAVSEAPNDRSFDTQLDICGKNPENKGEDHDVQDDSCTSYECRQPSKADSGGPAVVVAATQECQVQSDHIKHLQGSYVGVGHKCEIELSGAKVWDVGYLMGPKTDIDLLPTCNMMKEGFGDEIWNNKRDGKGIS